MEKGKAYLAHFAGLLWNGCKTTERTCHRQNSGDICADLSKWFVFSFGQLYCVARAVAEEDAIRLLLVTELGDLEADQGLSRERLHPHSL